MSRGVCARVVCQGNWIQRHSQWQQFVKSNCEHLYYFCSCFFFGTTIDTYTNSNKIALAFLLNRSYRQQQLVCSANSYPVSLNFHFSTTSAATQTRPATSSSVAWPVSLCMRRVFYQFIQLTGHKMGTMNISVWSFLFAHPPPLLPASQPTEPTQSNKPTPSNTRSIQKPWPGVGEENEILFKCI